jgi:hypothetical protein
VAAIASLLIKVLKTRSFWDRDWDRDKEAIAAEIIRRTSDSAKMTT